MTATLASLRARWGAAAPRVVGSLAIAPESETASDPSLTADPARTKRISTVVRTGFAALDAILGPGGLPRTASVAIRGSGSSGRTTLALRLAAEAQASGSIVAWVDLARSFDPVEAVARGIRLEWLVVVTPETLDEGLAIGAALLTGRSIDLLLLDLPVRPALADRPARVADRIHRLAALARRAEARLVVLESPGLAAGLSSAIAESTGLRLELARRSWIRLGRDIVGQQTEALVARNRYGPPGKRATLRILYAEGGERDSCLRLDDLLAEALAPAALTALATLAPADAPANTRERINPDASPPPPLAAPPPRTRPGTSLRALPARARDPGRSAVGSRDGRRREPGGAVVRHPAGDGPRVGTPARPGGALRRSGT